MKVSLFLPFLQGALLVAGDALPKAAPEALALPEAAPEASPEPIASPEDSLESLEIVYKDEVARDTSIEEDLNKLIARFVAEQLAKRNAELPVAIRATNFTNSTNTTGSTITIPIGPPPPANNTNTTNVTIPVTHNSTNTTGAINVTLPTSNNSTNVTAPGNVTIPVSHNTTNVTLPAPNNSTNVTAPGNVTLPVPSNSTNVTAPGNVTLPAPNNSTNVTAPGNVTLPVPNNSTNVTIPANVTAPGNVTLPVPNNSTNATQPCPLPTCPNFLRPFLLPFGKVPLAQQICTKVKNGTYKYQKSYGKLSAFIEYDVKLFCSCIAPKTKKRDLADATPAVEERDASNEAAEDLGAVFEKRDASQVADLVEEAHQLSKEASHEDSSDSQSFFGPSRLQSYGHGGSLLRTKRRTVRKTMIEIIEEI